jgi:uncharacterized repeat protein (TIGR01451 family)
MNPIRDFNPGSSRGRVHLFLLPAVVSGALLTCILVVVASGASGRPNLRQVPMRAGIDVTATGAIGDRVWNDLNRNGLQEAGEPGIYAVEMDLLDTAGSNLHTVWTDALGLYTFTNVLSGTYVVRVSPASFGVGQLKEWTPSPALVGGDPALDSNGTIVAGQLIYTVTVTANEFDSAVDFGLYPDGKSSVGDYVWYDRNADGGWLDLPEELEYLGGIDGVILHIYEDDQDGEFDPDPGGTGGAGDRLYAVTHTGAQPGAPGTHGWYNLGVAYPALYWIAVAAENFALGEPLYGLTDTLDDPALLPNLRAAFVPEQGDNYEVDFGFAWVADLGVIKTSAPNPYTPGLPITYTIVLTNAGPGATATLSLTEDLPQAVLTPVYLPTTGIFTPATGAWTGLNLASGSAISLTIVGLVPATSTVTLANQVAVTVPGMIDPYAANNLRTDWNLPGPTADLVVSKLGAPDPVQAGATVTYTILAANHGPSQATGVAVTDTLPAGVTLVAAFPTPNGGPSSLVWQVGDLAVNASHTFTVVATVGAGASGSITNTAAIAGREVDPAASNNRATVATTVTPAPLLAEADLTVTKEDYPDPALVGTTLTYSIVVTNNGPAPATGVTMSDTLPANVAAVAATPGHSAGNPLVWMLGDVAVNASRTLTIVVALDAGALGTLGNTATVAGAEVDPVTTNNRASATTAVELQHLFLPATGK